MSNIRSLTPLALASALVFASISNASHAAVSPEEAKALGTTLTRFGSEAGANADGSIPAYKGGTQAPPGYDITKNKTYPDPFAGEKPLYSIDSKNLSQYESLVTEGNKAMLKKFPTYRIDVYPTHRSVRYPDAIQENSVKNATTAELTGAVMGDGMKGAAPDGLPFAGVPFPIPKNGYEVIWNHKQSYAPAVMHHLSSAFLVDPNGGITDLPKTNQYHLRPWYDANNKLRGETFNATTGFSARLTTPPSAAGTVFLNYYLPSGEQEVWFYTPGQRRVRKAPEFAYDIPIAAYGGVLMWDELWGFTGRTDRFDFKLVGKKEMIVPYNVFSITNNVPLRAQLGKQHVNPDVLRWEKHRVWIVEAVRKEGARHAYKKRRFYIDEDSWAIVASESYDDGGNLWRVGNMQTFPAYTVGGTDNIGWIFNDLIKGNYFAVNMYGGDEDSIVKNYAGSDGLRIPTTPAAVAAGSVR